MINYTEKIVDVTTGKETIRPFNEEEIAEMEVLQAQLLAHKAKIDAEQAAKDAARQVVLDKLWLSADEVAALLG